MYFHAIQIIYTFQNRARKKKPSSSRQRSFICESDDFDDIDQDDKVRTPPTFSASKFSNDPGKPTLASEEEDIMGSEKGSGLISSLRRYPSGVFFMLGNEFCER